MTSVLQVIRILHVIWFTGYVNCQNGYTGQDLFRFHQMVSNDGQPDPISNYNTNIKPKDLSDDSVGLPNIQVMADDINQDKEYTPVHRQRSRKVYRIKNPFQDSGDGNRAESDNQSQDSETDASNQYAAIQYSLPPEEFLRQIRTENQYHQQQQQLSTPPSTIGYTATPQPQYQYSSSFSPNYESDTQQFNQISISQPQNYPNYPQYNGYNTYLTDNSTPSPSYQSSSTPNTHYVDTHVNSYVSSSSPIYISSAPNLNPYVSSSIPIVASSSSDYNNIKVTSTYSSNSMNYGENETNKNGNLDYYGNSANDIRYPSNFQQQYRNEYSSTIYPSSTSYPDSIRDSWQNGIKTGVNTISKDISLSLNQNPAFSHSQHDFKSISDNANNNVYRTGNVASVNNVHLNYNPPDSQATRDLQGQIRDIGPEIRQNEYYSHGDYGWKMTNKQPSNHDLYTPENYVKNVALGLGSDGRAVSQVSFHMDTSKPISFEQSLKTGSDSIRSQEFARAAAKAHENLRNQQMSGSNHPSGNTYSNDDKFSNKLYEDNSNSYKYRNTQLDLITGSPYYYPHLKDSSDIRQPFHQNNAIQHKFPIDLSNTVPNADAHIKIFTHEGNKFDILNSGRDQLDKNLGHAYKPITDSYNREKNSVYGFNIKTKPEDALASESLKPLESNYATYGKQQLQEISQNGNLVNKQINTMPAQQSQKSLISSNYQNNLPDNQHLLQSQVQSNIGNFLKLNDIPNQLIQGFSIQTNKNIPTQLPERLNQNVETHQIDVASSILNKLLAKQPTANINNPETDIQRDNLLSTINGFKVANPYNVDLKLVAEMLRGRSVFDEFQSLNLQDQFNKPTPHKLDLSQLQHLLLNNANYNYGSYPSFSTSLGAYVNPYTDIYNAASLPYRGVKYSRSQEEEESLIPIADASNSHPIGAVMEQDDSINDHAASIDTDLTGADDIITLNDLSNIRTKTTFDLDQQSNTDKSRHSKSSTRTANQKRKHKPKIEEPYPLLKPPSLNYFRNRGPHSKAERHIRRPRGQKRKNIHIKSEPSFETSSIEDSESIPTLLRPPARAAAKSDLIIDEESS